jgi:hypothetical protein
MAYKNKHKQKAWDAFSLYIRIRDCYIQTQTCDQGECVTCKRPYPLKSLQAGHFIAGRTNAVLFSERGCHNQCYGCNIGKNGNTTKYWLFMEEIYGREVIDELLAESETTVRFKDADYDNIAEKYQKLTEDIKNGRLRPIDF